jgi:tRNA pseudouridine55 synthase
MATGVLPVCIGKATRVIEFIDKDDALDAKSYDCEMRLGVRTDTLDIWGKVTEDADGCRNEAADINVRKSGIVAGSLRVPTEKEIRGVLEAMVGDIEQIPPAYSAIKYKGRKLYELARRGEDIPKDAIKPRKVHIERIEVTGIEFSGGNDLPIRGSASKTNDVRNSSMEDGASGTGDVRGFRIEDDVSKIGAGFGFATVRFSVVCSKGTYVRSIVRDAGESLDCGAAMSALRRTKSGVFTLADVCPIPSEFPGDEAERTALRESLSDALLPMDAAIPFLPSVSIDEAAARKFESGIQVDATPAHITGNAAEAREPVYARVYCEAIFCGIAKIQSGIIKPYKVIMP